MTLAKRSLLNDAHLVFISSLPCRLQHDDLGIYFVFLDLAVRAEGHFVLHFELLDLAECVRRIK